MRTRIVMFLAAVALAVVMYGLHKFAVWGADQYGLWLLVVGMPILLAIGFAIERRDRRAR